MKTDNVKWLEYCVKRIMGAIIFLIMQIILRLSLIVLEEQSSIEQWNISNFNISDMTSSSWINNQRTIFLIGSETVFRRP